MTPDRSDHAESSSRPGANCDAPSTSSETLGGDAAPELLCAFYRDAPPRWRARLLEVLLRPVGPLALVAIASGAFGALLHRPRSPGSWVRVDEASRISGDQLMDLLRYVEQSSPQALAQIDTLLTDGTWGAAALSASVLVLALRQWTRRRTPAGPPISTLPGRTRPRP